MTNSVKTILAEIRDKTPQQENRKYIFRGERKHYDCVSSGLYRSGLEYNAMVEKHRKFILEQHKLYPDHNLLTEHKDIIERKTIGLDEVSLENRQDKILAECKEFKLQPGSGESMPTETDLLSEIQHMGGFTKAIDFTWNPNVALYFACQPAECDVDLESLDSKDPDCEAFGWANGRIIICSVCREDISRVRETNVEAQCKFYSQKDIAASKTIPVFEPSHPESRAPAQESILIMPSEGYLTSEFFTTVNIPWKWKGELADYMKGLKCKKITAESLFQDVEGFVTYQKWLYYWMED